MGIGTNDMSTKQNDETQSRWYMVNKDGMCTLCADQADAEQVAKDAQEVWPHMGPHRAGQLSESFGAWFTAADMATASAQGFRDGQAEQAVVAAGWEFPALTPELAKILGTMCFQCITFSQALRQAGHQINTHPTTGEPMGTDAQEATAWRPKAENLEREIKPFRLYENLAKEYGILVFEGLEELQRENAALRDALQGAVSMAKDAHGHWDEDRDAKVGKHLLALAGANKGYDKRADAIHAAIAAQQGEKT